MKIALGMRLQTGPFGGGNRFGTALTTHLRAQGWSVVFDLEDRDIDLIVLTDPRDTIRSSAFQVRHILRYLTEVRQEALVVHRVNECDERKGGNGPMNALLRQANPVADHTIFVSAWLRDLFQAGGWPCPSVGVIRNGADPTIFNDTGHIPWDGVSTLRLVTHHWGANWLKGFDLYEQIDHILERPEWRDRISFTYIGNLPEGFRFRNARHIPPLNGQALADALRGHHVYVTGSQFEPGGNHQNEGAACGLPLLYRDSGSMPEYCQGYGLVLAGDRLEATIEEMMKRYSFFRARMPDWPHKADAMATQWQHLFEQMLSHRQDLLHNRRWPQDAAWLAMQMS
jgi:hypothetical protein